MRLTEIHLTRIRPPAFLLRPVRRNSVEYAELLDSIRDNGLWQPILVRPCGPNEYEIVEGHWRYTCCKQLRWETIPCCIRKLTDAEVLIAQLQANGIRPETTPVEFARRLERLLQASPGMTIPKLSKLIRKSPTWVRRVLHLNSLNREYSQMVSRGEIPVESATLLARMPSTMQDEYGDLARTLPAREFKPIAQAASKQYREMMQRKFINDHRINRPDPVPYLRKFLAIREEYENPTKCGLVLHQSKAETPMDGWRACLAWILHLDPASVKKQEEMFETQRRRREAAFEKRKLERQRLRELRESGEESFLETE